MQTRDAKVTITVIMWVMLCFISMAAIATYEDTNVSERMLLFMMLFPPTIAAIGTALMWVPEFRRGNAPAAEETAEINDEKAKRFPGDQSRLDMLMGIMDDDEREAFKETLKEQVLRDFQQGSISEDGELPKSLAALMAEEERQQSH